MVSVKLVNVSKTFGSVEALKRVNLEVRDGEFFAVLGPSGCGKTTMLRVMAGLEKPTEGRVFFNDVDVTNVPAEVRDVSMVFQFYALYPTTVFNNIALPLRSRGYSRNDVERRVREVAKLVGLEKLLNLHIDKLNVADKQRVALARAIAKEPQVYLLDEPLTILDPVTRVVMRSELKKLQKELRQTIIYVTHDQIEALTLADRIAVMNFGVVEQVGPPLEIYNTPDSVFVGWFLGEPGMNLIEVQVDSRNLSVRLGGREILRNPAVGKGLLSSGLDKALMGFRAESVALLREGFDAGDFRNVVIDGVLRVVEFFGTHFVVDVESGSTDFKVKLSPDEFTSLTLREGDRVRAVVSVDKVFFFDPSSGRRVSIGGGRV
ncbi:MAG: ABC transporter ATP-binding protein [Zestosphaera sp.]